MANGDNSTEFRLDLDAGDFIEQANKAAHAINAIGDSNIGELISGINEAIPLVGALGAAFFAIKGTRDLVFDAEKINQVNATFENLTANAGVFSEKLRAGLVESAKGWADETSLIGAANEALVKLDTGAEKLPQVMELARKATAVMGGDMIQNFEAISQAIATGNTRQLKHLGIIVDVKKAYQDYATQLGVSVSELSKAGQQQALMNAVLEQGNAKFKGVNDNVQPATNAWREFKVALKEAGEVVTLTWDRLFGPRVATGFQMLSNSLKGLKTWMSATFGEGGDQAKANVELINSRLTETKQKIADIEAHKGIGAALTPGEAKIQLELLNIQLQKYEAELEKAGAASVKFNKEVMGPAVPAGGGADDAAKKAAMVDQKKHNEELLKQKEALLNIDKQLTSEEMSTMDSRSEATELYKKQLKEEGEAIDLQIAKIKQQADEGILTHEQADAQIAKLNELKDKKMEMDDQQLARYQLQALDNYQAQSKNTFDGIGRGFATMSAKNRMALKDFGTQGTMVANSFGSHMTNAFQQIGAGAKSGTDAMKDAFFGMIADVAGKYGEMMMLSSIFPPNPAVFAAGAALEILAGALGAMAGSGPASVGNAGALDTGTAGTPGTANVPASPSPNTGIGTGSKGPTQNIIINGTMLTDDSTARWIVDKVRQASDAQGFTIQSVNGGF